MICKFANGCFAGSYSLNTVLRGHFTACFSLYYLYNCKKTMKIFVNYLSALIHELVKKKYENQEINCKFFRGMASGYPSTVLRQSSGNVKQGETRIP